jgi:prepilin-type N-terminal cleavage/methylation domain-containing protein
MRSLKDSIRFNKRGLTLIELIVGLVICAMVVAGIYRLFIAQSRAYTVQDQVVEVQQNIRSAMEIMLRDLRMTGFDDDRTPLVSLGQPILIAGDNSFTVRFEYNNAVNDVRYWLQGGTSLNRQETRNGVPTTETILQNVDALNITYGVDEDDNGAMDDLNGNGQLDDWIAAGAIGTRKVVSVRVNLSARPAPINADVQMLTPRTLVSAVTFRNMSLMR